MDTAPAIHTDAPADLKAAATQARAIASSDRENFIVLSRLVPESLRDSFAHVYAFCRHTDDLSDENDGSPESRETALANLADARSQLYAAVAGDPADPLYSNLASTIARHSIPIQHFDRLLDAFEQDQRVSRYETWDQLIAYCTKSADPVGRIVLAMGGHPPSANNPNAAERERLSDFICTGLQLANFWQDVRSDLLDRNRVYLPSEETGFDAETLRSWASRPNDPEARVPFIRALRPLVGRTRAMFEEARDLHRTVDPSIAAPVWLFHRAGIRLLTRIEASACTTLWHRPRVTKTDRLVMLAKAWLIARRTRR